MSRVVTVPPVSTKERHEVEGFSFEHLLYSDELVSAKDLNRQSGRILDMALQRPVTITRNDDAFALLKREEVSELIRARRYSAKMMDIMAYVVSRLLTAKAPNEHPLSWLQAFDKDEVRDFFTECMSVYQAALTGKEPWDALDTVLHEWEESAYAVASRDVQEAFEAAPDEVELTRPEIEEGPQRE